MLQKRGLFSKSLFHTLLFIKTKNEMNYQRNYFRKTAFENHHFLMDVNFGREVKTKTISLFFPIFRILREHKDRAEKRGLSS